MGYVDEGWWSRFAQPAMRAWAPASEPVRLVERAKRNDDPEPKALSCYGVFFPGAEASGAETSGAETSGAETSGAEASGAEASGAEASGAEAMLLRFVRGRPVSPVTTAFLDWTCERLASRGVRVWALVWDNAGWHISREVGAWIRAHNWAAKREGGVRILACGLPSRSPWLNPIEPKWLHGKRAICEPDAELTSEEVMARVCERYGCERLPPIEQKTP